MAITHTNRKGDVYYLHTGQTRAGKARYHFSKKKAGDLAEGIPEGYEVYEMLSGQVFLRKSTPRLITAEEEAVVEAGLRQAGVDLFRIDVETDSLIVSLPDQSREEAERTVAMLATFPRRGMVEWLRQRGSWSALMRFVLRDQEERRFAAQRWCFRGSIDNWTWDLAQGDLATLVARYAPHLGRESFFDLM
jgi:hypothetical protein